MTSHDGPWWLCSYCNTLQVFTASPSDQYVSCIGCKRRFNAQRAYEIFWDGPFAKSRIPGGRVALFNAILLDDPAAEARDALKAAIHRGLESGMDRGELLRIVTNDLNQQKGEST